MFGSTILTGSNSEKLMDIAMATKNLEVTCASRAAMLLMCYMCVVLCCVVLCCVGLCCVVLCCGFLISNGDIILNA